MREPGIGAEQPPRRSAWWLLTALVIGWATLTPEMGPPRRPFVWCLDCGPNWLSDIIANIALFVPLGAALVHARVRPGRAAAVGIVASLAIELLQRAGVVAGRTPALADILANGFGTALGALAASRGGGLGRSLVTATGGQSRILLAVWTTFMCVMLAASAWAVAPAVRAPAATATRDSVATSWMPTIPGREFIQSSVVGIVDGVQIPVKSTGQIVASVPPRDTVRITLLRRVINERDRRDRLIFLAYVHGKQSTVEQVVIGQFGDDILLRSAVNASRIGLQTPALRVRGVFALDSVLMWKTTRIDAVAAPGRLSLDVETPDRRIGTVTGALALTPALGWTLIQPIVGATARIAPLLTGIWLVIWFFPGGLWLGRAIESRGVGPRRALATRVIASALWCTVPLGVAQVAVRIEGISPLAAWQIVCGVGGAVVGAIVSSRIAATTHPIDHPTVSP